MISACGRASNAIERGGGRSQMGGVRERILVPQLSLDTLLALLPRPSFVKIDVEGAKALVLVGACRLLEEARPTIFVEGGEEATGRVTEQLLASDYVLLDSSQPRVSRRPLAQCVFETLAVPRERWP